MNADLLRQRRNLIAISAVLLIFDFAKVTITKVSVLGTELLVGNAQVLMVCAWILWAYFLLRYYQYWRAERDQHIRETFNKRLDKYVRAYTKVKPLQDSVGQIYNDYKISRTGFAWAYTPPGIYDLHEGRVKAGPPTSIPAWRVAVWVVKSAVFVCVQTTYATDHVLPFALAIAAPIATLCTK